MLQLVRSVHRYMVDLLVRPPQIAMASIAGQTSAQTFDILFAIIQPAQEQRILFLIS